jgi:hypothetical protein
VETLDALLDSVIGTYRIDEDRVVLTGLSMGGQGTWQLAAARPDRFAAIAPVCGRGNPEAAHRLRRVPAWVFHGAQDDVVPIGESERMVAALERCAGDVRFTVYPDAGHDAWTATYERADLWDWLLSHRRTPRRLIPVSADGVSASSGDFALAVDGDPGTRWESEWTDPQWAVVDLGRPTAVHTLTILWETAYGSVYDVLASDDGTEWRPVFTETASDGCADEIPLGDLETRWLKMAFRERGTQWGYSIWEIELE